MHSLASTTPGAFMAPVGHRSMQRVQRPQVPVPGGSGSRSRSTIKSAIKKYEPTVVYEAGVPPEEPEPRVLGRGAFQERHGVREAASFDPDPQFLLQLPPQPKQPLLYDLVVVLSPRVPRHPAPALVLGMVPGIVGDPQRDHAPGALLQLPGVREKLHGPVHVAHVGGHPRLLPLPQSLATLTQGLRGCHAYEVEARLPRPLLENAPRPCRIVQYSLSAHTADDCTRRRAGKGYARPVKALADVSTTAG